MMEVETILATLLQAQRAGIPVMLHFKTTGIDTPASITGVWTVEAVFEDGNFVIVRNEVGRKEPVLFQELASVEITA